MATYGHIEQFTGISTDWSAYQERLEQYLEANDLGAIAEVEDGSNAAVVQARDSKRRAILLSVMGPKTYTLLRSLITPEKPTDKSYDEILSVLKHHYAPAPSVTVQRYKFAMRKKKADETMSEYVSELRKIAEHCGFNGVVELEDRLKDQMVIGVGDEQLQKRLLMETHLSFNKCYKMCISQETAARDVPLLSGNTSERTTSEEVNKVTSKSFQNPGRHGTASASNSTASTERRCYRCDSDRHLANRCKHKDVVCHCCKKIGHLAKVCFSKKSGQTNLVEGVKVADDNNINNSVDSGEHSAVLYNIRTNEMFDKPIYRELIVDGENINFQVDTGSGYTLINSKMFHSRFKNVCLNKPSVNLSSYTGGEITVVGDFDVTVVHNDKNYILNLLVVDGNGPPLLGRRWLHAMQDTIVCNVNESGCNANEDLFVEFSDLFDESKLGCLKEFRARIEVIENAPPTFCKARPVPFALKPEIEKELDELEKNGVIRKVKYSEWAAPIVPVQKESGRYRLCGDYKLTVNRVSKVDTYPLPLVDELFVNIAGGQSFSKLDLSQAYHQICLHEDSYKLTTINTHKGLYEYTRLPFGINTAVALFQRTMETLLKGFKGVSCYLDDILVTGSTLEEHKQNLKAVLSCLSHNGFRLKKDKCHFFMQSVEYLGFQISAAGICPTEEKVRAIRDSPSPRNISELKSFTGLVNYYSRFFPNLAQSLAPLYRLMRKDVPWRWGQREQVAFEKTKRCVTTEVVLAHYDTNKELILSCDASPHGIGAVLQQDVGGMLRPLAYVSRSLNRAEQNYAQIDREGLAIVFGACKFRQYLLGRHWTLLTDHQPLVTLFGERKGIPQMASARIKRWALILSAYNYTIRHTAGKDNACADFLSRCPLAESEEERENREVLFLQTAAPFNSTVIARESRHDRILAKVIRYTQEGWPRHIEDPELRTFFCKKDELSVEKGVLLWGYRVVIPQSLKSVLLFDLHSGHDGIVRMKSVARSYFWWPNIDRDIEGISADCERCQNNAPLPSKAPTATWNWPNRPWSRLHLDYAGPFMGHMFLIIVDAHSKWFEVFKNSGSTSESTIRCLTSLFTRFGLPEHVVTDNGTCFVSEEFKQFLDNHGIQHTTTAPGHPATNGQAERYVGYFKKQMSKLDGVKLSIDDKINKVLFAYRTTQHPATGETPAKLMFGRELRTKYSVLKPSLHCNKEVQDFCANSSNSQKFTYGQSVYALNLRAGARWMAGKIIDVQQRNYFVEVNGKVWKRHENQLRARKDPGSEFVREFVPDTDTNSTDLCDVQLRARNDPDSEIVRELVPDTETSSTGLREVQLSARKDPDSEIVHKFVPETDTSSADLCVNVPRRNPERNRVKPLRFRDDL